MDVSDAMSNAKDGMATGSAASQPSQSHAEQEAPHWPDAPHAQLHSALGGGGGSGAGAQPSQSQVEQADPH